MPKFSSVNGEVQDALTVSLLLNKNNRLTVTHNITSILNSNVNYILLYDIPENANKVIGCIGMCVQDGVTVLKHLSISQQCRGKGYGKYLVAAALATVKTKTVRAFIRSDNIVSLHIFEAAGFMAVGWKQVTQEYRLVAVEKQT